MIRAAATGVIDYAKFDPDDHMWFRRHRWLLGEVETSVLREAMHAQQQHATAVLGIPGLSDEHFAANKTSAKESLNSYLKLLLPWEADRLAKAHTAPHDDLVALHQSVYGRPGEAKYEAMLKAARIALRPRTRAEKARDQQRMRDEWNRRKLEQLQAAQSQGGG